jgi:hypothetical protein
MAQAEVLLVDPSDSVDRVVEIGPRDDGRGRPALDGVVAVGQGLVRVTVHAVDDSFENGNVLLDKP